MKPLSLVAAVSILLAAGSAAAQVYTVQSQSSTYAPLTGAGVQLPAWVARSTFQAKDEGYIDLALGFSFPYYGTNYTTVHIDTNGFLMFGGGTTCTTGFACYSGGGIPSTTRTPHAVIAPWWQDEDGATAGELRTKASAGQMEIEWSNWSRYGGGFTFNVKVTLTASGLFQVHYGSFTGSVTGATVGWENQTGTAGGNYLNCSATTAACGSTNWPTNTLFTIGQPVQPDVVVTTVNISNLVVDTNNRITVTVAPTFQNFGQNAATGPFAWKAYLSTDRNLDAADRLIYTSTPSVTLTGAGTAGATASASGAGDSLTPMAPGQYYVLVEADTDNVITEAIESNNVGSTANFFVNGLDLVATGVSGPANSGPGNSVSVNVKFFNQGTAAAPNVKFRVLLSLDAVASTNDFILIDETRNLTGGQTVDENVAVTVGGNVPGGDFFYILQLDPLSTITEASETNNTFTSVGKVTMKQADLVNTGADFLDPITAAPTRVGYFGQPARATVKMDNIGGANAVNFKVGVVVSTDATLSLLSDAIVHEADVALVAQGTSLTLDIPFTLPLTYGTNNTPFTTGNYYVFVILDSTSKVTELNEQNNNAVIVGTVTLRTPAPDLVVTRVETAASGAVGEALPVLRTLKNIGNVNSTAVKYRYFASANPIITTSDVPLKIHTGTMTSLEGSVTLAIGEANTTNELVTLPPSMAPGTYFIGCIIDTDGTVAELDEQNNTMSSQSIVVAASSLRVATSQLPDAVVDRPYSYQLVALGEQGGATTWKIDATQGGLPMGMTLSADGLITGIPTMPVVSAVTVVVTNSARDALARLVLRVLPTTTQVEITTVAIPAVVNDPAVKFEYSLGAAGGVKPYEWRLVSGVLPQTLTLSSNGLIVGIPRVGLAEGVNTVVIEVKDSLGTVARKSLALRVVARGSILFRNLTLVEGLVNEAYFTDIAVQNADGTQLAAAQKPLVWSKQGELPDGLMMNPSGDVVVLEGKPLRAGIYSFSLTVEDAKGHTDTAELSIRILPSRFKLSSVGQPEVIRPGEAVSFTIVATSKSNVVFRLYSGMLAPGLTLAADGTVSGTVPQDNAEGTYSFVVEAKDAVNATGLGAFSLEVKREARQTGCSAVGGFGFLLMLAPLVLRRRRSI